MLPFRMFRSTTSSSSSSSRSFYPHPSPLSLHSGYSVPGARTDLARTAKPRPLTLATRHLPRAAASLSPFPATLTVALQLTENLATLSPATAALTRYVTHKSFACHSYKKHPGWESAIFNFFVAQTSVCALLRQSTSGSSEATDPQELKNLAVQPVTILELPVTASALFLPPVTGHQSQVTKSCGIRTSEKRARNSCRIRTSKTQDLKPFRMNTCKKTGGGGTSFKPKPALSFARLLLLLHEGFPSGLTPGGRT